jgi:hypothetical protein
MTAKKPVAGYQGFAIDLVALFFFCKSSRLLSPNISTA